MGWRYRSAQHMVNHAVSFRRRYRVPRPFQLLGPGPCERRGRGKGRDVICGRGWGGVACSCIWLLENHWPQIYLTRRLRAASKPRLGPAPCHLLVGLALVQPPEPFASIRPILPIRENVPHGRGVAFPAATPSTPVVPTKGPARAAAGRLPLRRVPGHRRPDQRSRGIQRHQHLRRVRRRQASLALIRHRIVQVRRVLVLPELGRHILSRPKLRAGQHPQAGIASAGALGVQRCAKGQRGLIGVAVRVPVCASMCK